MTRLGFGLSYDPRIMSRIRREVQNMDARMKGTDLYIDDIIVDENIMSAEEVRSSLRNFGLKCKDPEAIVRGKVLGLKINRGPNASIWFKRRNSLPVVGEDVSISRRDLFSMCETCRALFDSWLA